MNNEVKKESWPTEALLNYFINFFSFLTLASLASTGLFILPNVPEGQKLLGFSEHAWGELHERLGLMLLVMIAIHLYRHRGWIKAISKKELGVWNPKTKLILMMTAMTLMTFVIVAATALVER